MKYDNITEGVFLERPNRFIAKVKIGDDIETVHVKNTGRCKELLVPGCQVWLARSDDPKRKTGYDLVAVRKDTGVLFNIDSQAPNKVAREWLESQGYDVIIPEHTYGDSRLDFYMEKNMEETSRSCHEAIAGRETAQSYLMEVKGCTLEVDGVGYFPDAPTERGTKHIRELIRAASDGYNAILCFVIQMDGVYEVRPNRSTDPAFAEAIEDARKAGVQILFLCCHVEPDSLKVVSSSPYL